MTDRQDAVPLSGLWIIEFVGIGPGQFARMMLADMGAEIIRIDRPTADDAATSDHLKFEFNARGRRSLALDLKVPGAVIWRFS